MRIFTCKGLGVYDTDKTVTLYMTENIENPNTVTFVSD